MGQFALNIPDSLPVLPVLGNPDSYTYTKDPTGFTDPQNVIVTYDSSTKKITLTGTVAAYWRGTVVSSLVSGYVSPALTDTYPTPNTVYYLSYDGTSIGWSSGIWTFDKMQIAVVIYTAAGTFLFAQRECHGLMPWTVHEEFHETIGAFLESGGDLQNYTLNSTTAAQRRPDTSAAYLHDEDLVSVLPAKTNKLYNVAKLTGTGTISFNVDQADIVPLNGNHPYWNQYTGGAWTQTLMSNNFYATCWKIAIPVTSDTTSQKYRFSWIQPQSESVALSTQQALGPASLNLGGLTGITPEVAFIDKVIIQYTASNWKLIQVDKLTGTKFNQIASPAGTWLTSASTDGTLSGNGTSTNPLSVIEGLGLTKTMTYNVDGTLNVVTSANGTKTMAYNVDGTLASVTGTGIYKTKTFTYSSGNLTGVTVS